MQGNVKNKSEFNPGMSECHPGGTCNGNKATDSADREAWRAAVHGVTKSQT